MSSQGKRENYHIISLIGKGAYGQVYKGRKKQTGQFVAIKTIKKKGKQQKDIKAMREQISILKKLKHPNIVVLLDSFETSAQFIIVTELGQGELFNIIEDDQYLEEPQIRKVAQQLVRALHYIHSNRVTHRDLKPQNILMTSEGNIKLCDFGFARYMSYKTEVLTSLKGTPLYMAPEVVQQQPYTHTADLWSLGVILYQLSTGSPPFSAANLLTLVQHITKDPVRYPQSIQGDFKNLLKGLLNKDPNARLGWPDLLNHPFIRESEQQKVQRKSKVDKFSNWIQENHYIQEDQSSYVSINTNTNSKLLKELNYEQKQRSKQVSKNNNSNMDGSNSNAKVNSQSLMKAPTCSDSAWNNYSKMANEEKGANQLRVDSQFLDKLLSVLSGNASQIMRNKEQKNLLQTVLRVLTQVLMKSKTPDNKNADISKKLNIPNYLLLLLKTMLKMENGRNYVEIISDITKLIGLLAKTTFNKSIGIQMVYVRSFIPLLPSLLSCATSTNNTNDAQYQTLTMNLLRTIGIFANNASVHYLRSFSFYKDIVEIKFIPEFIAIFKCYSDNVNLNVHKLLVQVISAFMHPVYGDIECFPWKRPTCSGIQDYKDFSTMLECVKQSIINGLLELDWMTYFQKILQLEDQSAILPKISISRIILQALRQSKQFSEILLARPKPNLVVINIFTLLSYNNPIVYCTNCLTVSHILKLMREKKKQQAASSSENSNNFEKQYITQNIINLLISRVQNEHSKSNGLFVFGSLMVMQQLLSIANTNPNTNTTNNNTNNDTANINININISAIVSFLTSEKCIKIVSSYLSNSDKSKLEEMRNIEGSNYGLHVNGYYDPVFLTYHRLFIRLQKQDAKEKQLLYRNIATNSGHFENKLTEILCKLSSKTDVSPKGMIAYLMLIYDIISNNGNNNNSSNNSSSNNNSSSSNFSNNAHAFVSANNNNEMVQSHLHLHNNFLKSLIELLSEQTIQSLSEWPIGLGGGQPCLQIFLGTVMNILLMYLQQAYHEPQILKIMYAHLIQRILEYIKYINQENINITTIITFLYHLLSFTNQKANFVLQFVELGGLSLFVRYGLLKCDQYEISQLIQACNLLSQIARYSKDVYEHIDGINVFEDIRSILKYNNNNNNNNNIVIQLKSRTLNLLANLCRHSNHFYSTLVKLEILPIVISLLSHQDRSIRKQSCIVVGNAAFHDSTLYLPAKCSIQTLVGLLKDGDEKIRSNAAAALGNLARNSEVLDGEFVGTGANYQLVNMVINDKSHSAKRVAIMAIINLLALPESSKILKSLNLPSILSKFTLPNSADLNLAKTAQKALDKLQ